MTHEYDYLVIGSGIAGMSFALKVAAKGGRVALICKTTLEESNTALAQGGVASVTNLAVDNFDKHIHDTMVAGDWLSDPKAVEKVVRNAPSQINQLLEWGVNFDRKDIDGITVDWIKRRMERLGLKSKHLSNYTGIDKCTVSSLLSGDKELTKWHKVALYYFFKYYEVANF